MQVAAQSCDDAKSDNACGWMFIANISAVNI